MSNAFGFIGPQVMPPNVSPNLGADPASNNQPLQFNTNKGKPTMGLPGKSDDKIPMMDKDERIVIGEKNGNSSGGPIMAPPGGNMDMAGMMGGPGSMMGGPLGFGPMMGDPSSMMMMGPMGFNQFGGFMGPMQGMPMNAPMQKEIITVKDAVLYPPPPNAPPPTTRECPPGCRTIFVGGLPENITEEILRQIFEQGGPIQNIRLSKKNFAHIRFEDMSCVDNALYISGYRIKIGNKDDKENTGRLHVDYAQARDDLHEWECQQRALAREMRHRQRIEEERLRPASPPPIIHFSDHEASVLIEKLKGDDTFMKGTQVLMTWLERGDCNRRTANTFYSMVQSVHSHVRRLLTEKTQHDQELEEMKLKFRQRLEGIIRQFEQIDKVFGAATKQKAWDHFSKAQRKNLDVWKKQAEEIKTDQQAEFLKNREEAEMEMSDSEEGEESQPQSKKRKEDVYQNFEYNAAQYALNNLKEENDALKCQLEAYKNEVDLVKHDVQNDSDEKDKQMKVLQQALQGMQQQLINANQQVKTSDEELSKLREENKELAQKAEKCSLEAEKKDNLEAEKRSSPLQVAPPVVTPVIPTASPLDEKKARLIGIIATFLHVHPFGASIDYINSYLHRLEIIIRSSEMEDLLESLPTVFKQDFIGVGATLEKRWKFIGFAKVDK